MTQFRIAKTNGGIPRCVSLCVLIIGLLAPSADSQSSVRILWRGLGYSSAVSVVDKSQSVQHLVLAVAKSAWPNEGLPSGVGELDVGSWRVGSLLDSMIVSSGGLGIFGIGDINKDDVTDYVVSNPRLVTNGSTGGMCWIVSGKDGVVLSEIAGKSFGDRLGWSTAMAVSNNGRIRNLFVGAPGLTVRDGAGYVRQVALDRASISGETKISLPGIGFGDNMVAIDDVTNDGYSDVLVALTVSQDERVNWPSLYLLSGRDGSCIREIPVSGTRIQSRLSMLHTGDMDGDTFSDYVVGMGLMYKSDSTATSASRNAAANAGRIALMSGGFHARIWSVGGFRWNEGYGVPVAKIEDRQAGRMVLVVGRAGASEGRGGLLSLIDPVTGLEIGSIGDGVTNGYLKSLASIGDVNGDGCDDIAAYSSSDVNIDAEWVEEVLIIDGRSVFSSP